MPVTNRILNKQAREAKKVDRHYVSGVLRHPTVLREEQMKSWKLVVAVGFLLPLVVITVVTALQLVGRALVYQAFWKSSELGFFLLGGVAWWAMFYSGIRLVSMYVHGHEWSHAITALVCGGKIYKVVAGPNGGYVDTNKSNTWITLAPYLVPLFTMVLLGVSLALSFLIEIRETTALPIGSLFTLKFQPIWICSFLIGWSWFFHITYTIKTIRLEQGDLVRNGEFFSIILIFFSNLLLLVTMFLLAASGPDLTFLEVFHTWWHTFTYLVGWVWTILTQTV